MRRILLLLCLLAGFASQGMSAELTITSQADNAVVTSLNGLGGDIQTGLGITTVTLSIKEPSTAGGGDHWWNGTAWQSTVATLPTLVTATTWTNTLAFTAPPLVGGRTYVIDVSGAKSAGGTATATVTVKAAVPTLTWDDGSTHLGTSVYSQSGSRAGAYYFKIVAQNTSVGAWRTALNVAGGEANVYMSLGSLPATDSYAYKSDRTGSDGFVLHSSQFGASQEWFIMVAANEGAQWNLVSGEAFVANFGTLAADGSSGSGAVTMGAEGMRFFRTSVPADTLAWRLWMNGGGNTIRVKRSAVPHPVDSEVTQAEQLLLVPPYLDAISYYLSVEGVPGATVNLDSRKQAVTDVNFVSSTAATVTGYGYTTYRVQVPVQQIGWEVAVVPTSGNPNFAIRRGAVPNEYLATAFSAAEGLITDSATLVPPTLSDGTFYITVYGNGSHAFTVNSGNPLVTDINFSSSTVNDATTKVGWRYYRVANIDQQLGHLGWDLFLQSFPAGTELALRRNALPGRWNALPSGGEGYVDHSGPAGFIQRPGHQADIWYIGVYNPTNTLGAFTLQSQPLTAQTITLNTTTLNIVNQPSERWQFFRVDVPANIEGWNLRLKNVTGGHPRLVVRRDELPPEIGNTYFFDFYSTSWPTAYQLTPGTDWTGYPQLPDGTSVDGQLFAASKGYPLEPGTFTYYIGVKNYPHEPGAMTYTLESRGIGTGQAITVADLNFTGAGSSVTVNDLPAREAAYFKVTVPAGRPSWKLRLTPSAGDVLLLAQKGKLPNLGTGRFQDSGVRLQKSGREHLIVFPGYDASALVADDYYLAVVSEGVGAEYPKVGPGNASFTLESLGSLSVTPIGTLGAVGAADLTTTGSVEGGEFKAYSFSVPTGTLAMEVRLEATTGLPGLAMNLGTNLPAQGYSFDSYGQWNGYYGAISVPDGYNSYVTTVANPVASNYTFIVKAMGQGAGVFPNASYTVRLKATEPDPLDFNAGTVSVTSQGTNTWRYYKVIVPSGPVGWELRLNNVTGGNPELFVRRDLLPSENSASVSYYDTSWPSGAQAGAAGDYTRANYDSDNVYAGPWRQTLGMGSPLEPGVYYVGVRNGSTGSATSYTLTSRGIGDGYAIAVTPVSFSGGSVTSTSLATRETQFLRVDVPANTPSWKFRLAVASGDALLAFQRGALPSHTGGTRASKPGYEIHTIFPPDGETYVPSGPYYLVVVSLGNPPPGGFVGPAGTSSTTTFTSVGVLPNQSLGSVGATDITFSSSLESGEVKAYDFTVPAGTASLVISQENTAGAPAVTLRRGSDLPSAGSFGSSFGYGNEGGRNDNRIDLSVNSTPVTLANPAPGVYRLVTQARYAYFGSGFENASHTVRLHVEGSTDLNFAGGSANVTGQPVGTWRYFKVVVPADAAGWDVRLANVSGGDPRLTIRRDVPPDVFNGLYAAETADNWPSGAQLTVNLDYTSRHYPPVGETSVYGQIYAVGMGRPLEPGTYYVGVYANALSGGSVAYTINSRGIGAGYQIPVSTLAFVNGTASVSGLAPREAAYYRIDVPADAATWKLKLTATAGESMFILSSGAIPNTTYGKHVQKTGNEHYVLLPSIYSPNLEPGKTYYLAVVGEGVNPADASRVGTGTSSFQIQSFGQVGFTSLGTVSTTDTVRTDSLEGGELRYYRFTVPEGTPSLDVRLENRTGNPVMYLVAGESFYHTGVSLDYGLDGYNYVVSMVSHPSVISVPNPAATTYTLLVKAQGSGVEYPDADFTIRLHQPNIPELNFSSEQNGNGKSNVGSGSVADGEKVYYKIVVPDTYNGGPVIGWRLDLAAVQGSPTIRIEKNYLPSDQSSQIYPGTEIVVPPTLSPGIWYVAVSSSGAGSFTLTSSGVKLERPAWSMPLAGQSPNTPGLTGSFFADTGVNVAGVASSGDQGIDLGQGDYHFYAVTVPPGNGALLRVQLDAINGTPELYVKRDIVAKRNGYERSLTGGGTKYANWVPGNGQYERELAPGTWYFAVYGGGNSNVRYRLRLSTGSVQDLALNGGSVVSQTIAAGDWRYYRVQIPQNAPLSWNVTFGQTVGDVIMHVRDVVPPGNVYSSADLADWGTDQKSYISVPRFDPPGTYSITLPPLRPGSTYYLGFKAVNDATFTVSSAVSGGSLPTLPTISFYGGTASSTLAGHGTALYRIDVPADALRMKLLATNSGNVGYYLTQGTLLDDNINQSIWSSIYGYGTPFFVNPVLNQTVGTNNWPWLVSQSYYLLITNSVATSENYVVHSDGRSAANEDADEDGILDVWELQYFGYTYLYGGNDDADGDGFINRLEFMAGTNPTNAASYFPVLNVATNGTGSIGVVTAREYYSFNESVTLTATPGEGKVFLRWEGDATGSQNPLTISMTTNKAITAVFITPPFKNDNFVDRYLLTGSSASTTATNQPATRETGEPFHANATGHNSLWWKWVAPASGSVTISTVGSTFDTILGVYTGTAVDALTVVVSDDDSGGSGTSRVTFSAVAGTEYQIAVDGFGGQTGDIVLSLSQVVAPANDNFANRIVLSGASASGTAVNTLATAQSGEPNIINHGTGHTVWWSWTAPSSGSFVIDTIGSNFDTLLGVYTGTAFNALTLVAADDESGGNNTSKVQINAVAGTTYQILVDSYFSSSTGTVMLHISQAIPIAANSLSRAANGQFSFTFNGPAGQAQVVEWSPNLKPNSWTPIQTNNAGGTLNFTDTTSPGNNFRFYRVKILPALAP